jgi:shikimate dehydrogenase
MGFSELRLVNRTETKAETLKKDLLRTKDQTIKIYSWDQATTALKDVALLVNTTSLGMQGKPALDISLADLPSAATVTDIVYAPLLTDLLKQAQARGNKIVDGLGMLLHQARPQFEAWFGIDPEVTQELRAYVLEIPNE